MNASKEIVETVLQGMQARESFTRSELAEFIASLGVSDVQESDSSPAYKLAKALIGRERKAGRLYLKHGTIGHGARWAWNLHRRSHTGLKP